jgi:hypothetical protein
MAQNIKGSYVPGPNYHTEKCEVSKKNRPKVRRSVLKHGKPKFKGISYFGQLNIRDEHVFVKKIFRRKS